LTPAETLILSASDRRDAVTALIRGARTRVALSMFRCTDFKVMDELADALKRGVQVDLLLTQRAKGWEKRIRKLGVLLESMGANVHRYSLAHIKYHAKYLLVDGEYAMVASLNFTTKCFEQTCDFMLLTQDPAVVDGLNRLFRHDIEQPAAPLSEDLPKRLIAGPDAARRRLKKLIRNARQSIILIDHKVKDRKMLEELLAASARGIDVRVYGRDAVPGHASHGKLMLVDNERAVIGSIALARPSLNTRREVAIVIEHPGAVGQLARFTQELNGALQVDLRAVLDDKIRKKLARRQGRPGEE